MRSGFGCRFFTIFAASIAAVLTASGGLWLSSLPPMKLGKHISARRETTAVSAWAGRDIEGRVDDAAKNVKIARQATTKPALVNQRKTRVVIACVGDSITFGFGANASMDYPAQLQKMIGHSYLVHNFGHSGRCMQKKPSFSYWRSKRFQEALASLADIVVIMLGTNDGLKRSQSWMDDEQTGAEPFVKDYKAMIKAFSAMKSRPSIHIMTPPPVYRSLRIAHASTHAQKKAPPTEEEARVVNTIIPSLVRKVHQEMTLTHSVIDIFENMGGLRLLHPEWSMDGVHPNDCGYKEIAIAVMNGLRLEGAN